MLPLKVPSGLVGINHSTVSSLSDSALRPKAFITHAALLRQGFPHCAIFPTAASRRSLGRVSVPVWLIILSDQLPISALVGHYPTNYLMAREPHPKARARRAPFLFTSTMTFVESYSVLAILSNSYPQPKGRLLTCYSPVRRSTRPEGLSRSTCMC